MDEEENEQTSIMFAIMRLLLLLLITNFITGLSNGQVVYYEKGKYGVKNNTGDIIVKAQYDFIWEFKQGYTTFEKKKLKGLMDSTGTIITSPAYDYIRDYEHGYFMVQKDDRWGLVNRWGKETIKPIYESLHQVKPYDLFYVRINRRYGLQTGEGKVLLEPLYYNQVLFNKKSGVSTISNTYGDGMVDTTGKILIPVHYDKIDIRGSLAWVKRNSKWGLFDIKGKELMPVEYSDIVQLDQGLLVAIKDKKYYFHNTKGGRSSTHIYDMAFKFTEGYGKVKRNNKFGFIDTRGNEVISCQYDSADVFRNGKARVKKGGKEFFIDKPSQKETGLDLQMLDENNLAKVMEGVNKLNSIFNSNPLAAMEAKATEAGLYKTLLQQIETNMDWKKTNKVMNSIEGKAFLLYKGSSQKAEIFFNKEEQFCYYNKVVNADERSAALKELKTNQFILKTKRRENTIVENWEKTGVPYRVTIQYDEGEKTGSIALIAHSFLQKVK